LRILIFSLVDLEKSAHNSRLHQFLKYLSRNHEITVLCLNDWWKAQWDSQSNEYNKDFEQLFQKISIKYVTEKKISPVLQDLLSAFYIHNILDEIKFSDYDLFYNYNGLSCGSKIAKLARTENIPVVFDIADDLPEMISTSPQIPAIFREFGKMVGRRILDKNVRFSDKVTITTNYFQSLYGIPIEKTEILPNGVDAELFYKKEVPELREKLGLSDSFVVGHVGVLREWLDFHPLFSAIKDLSSTYNIKLLLVGGGIGYDDTVQLAESYGITDKVVFTGTIPYPLIPDYIGCMDVCTVPFKNDSVAQNSLPLKIFEYMACEKPVICSEVRAIREIFNKEILFVSGSDEYKQIIVKLYGDIPLRQHLGSEGRRAIEADYHWESLSNKLEQLMTELHERA